MSKNKYIEIWENYKMQELHNILPIIDKLGFVLDDEQIHIEGERYLMSGYKLVLYGRYKKNNKRVVIKVSSHTEGKKEIAHTYSINKILKKLKFTYRNFFSPEDILFRKYGKYIIYITTYIEQEQHFIDYPLEKQFFMSINAFEEQESAHALAYSHVKEIKKTFTIVTENTYLKTFKSFGKKSLLKDPLNKDLENIFVQSLIFLTKNKDAIKQYLGFLTHTDFVPHNMRIINNNIYLIDHSAIYFGNKYESWARFINFMTVHNPKLEKMLVDYIRNNRDEDEYLSLRLMRIYKIGFLLKFYTNSLTKTSGELNKLVKLRISFWIKVLKSILEDKQISKDILIPFLKEKEILRSDQETKRQKEIFSKTGKEIFN